MKTGKIVEARKDGVNYIHVVEDNLNLDGQQHGPNYKAGWLIAKRERMVGNRKVTNVHIPDPQVGQAITFDIHTDDSGSKSARNVSAR
jgi:hypothetical protein